MESTTVKTINLVPTWEAAVRIYMMVLTNESAPLEAKNTAEEEIIKLARAYDELTNEGDDE